MVWSKVLMILICFLSPEIIGAHQVTTNATVGEFIEKQIEVINNATKDLIEQDVIRFQLPPISLKCNNTNTTNIRIVKRSSKFIFFLSADELLAIDFSTNSEVKAYFIGTLLQITDDVIDVQVEFWQSMLVIIVIMPKSLNVYVTKNDFVKPVKLEPIQKFNVNSALDQFIFFKNQDDLFLISYEIKEGTPNQLIFFKWKTSFFSQESMESVDLPSKSKLSLLNENTKEPLVLSIGFGNSSQVVILKLSIETGRWTKLQSMHFKQDYIKHYVFEEKLFLLGCSSDSFCAIYKWSGVQFKRYHKLGNQVNDVIKETLSRHNIVITENSQKKLSFFTSDDITGIRPGLVRALPPNVVGYTLYKSQEDNQLSFVEFRFTQTSLEIAFYPMEIEKGHEIASRDGNKQKDPIECVSRLKAFLKSRIPKIHLSQKHAQNISSQDNTLQMESKKYFKTKFTSVKSSKVEHVKMPYSLKLPLRSLQKRAVDTNIMIEQTRLSLKKPQSPRAEERAEVESIDNLVVQNLIHNDENSIFKGLLLNSQSVFRFKDQIKLRNVTANKIVVPLNKVNEIQLNELLNKTLAKHVKGLKVFKNLKVADLTVTQTLNNLPLEFLAVKNTSQPQELSEGFEFIGDINVKDLVVKSLNGFNASALLKDVFLTNSRNVIRGNLIFNNVASVNQLQADTLMNLPVENLMTTSTDQKVTSNIFINKFHVTNMEANLINNEKFSENVATANEVNFIEVPTQFLTIHILKNLNIKDEDHEDSEKRVIGLSKTIENLKRHVIGTQTTDLSQIYNNQVVIHGSLFIKDAKMFSQKTRIFVNDKEVPQNIPESFWMKNVRQEIPVDLFSISNPIMETNSLVSNNLNGLPVRQLLLLDAKSTQGPVNIRFEKLNVLGDVKGHRDNIPSLLFHLHQLAVPQEGPPTEIQSSISFRGKLASQKLDTLFVNDSPVADMAHSKQQTVAFKVPKRIKELQASRLQVDNQLFVQNFNNLDLQKFIADAVRIDKPIELASLSTDTFDATSLATQFFEDHDFNEFIASLEKEFELTGDGSTSLLRNIKVEGNLEFQSNVFVSKINDKIQFNEFIKMLVLNNEFQSGIGGKKVFQQNLIVSDLQANLFNELPLDRLIHKSLQVDAKQEIVGEFFVKNLITKSLQTKALNNVTWNQFVSKTKIHLPLNVNLDVKDLKVKYLDTKSSSYDLNKMMELAQFPKRVNWDYVTVSEHTDFSLQKSSLLERLLSTSVFKRGPPQVVLGKVQIDSYELYIESINQPDMIVATRSGYVDLKNLLEDSVKSESKEPQIVLGKKTFTAYIYFNNLKIGANAFYASQKINNVDIIELNSTIYRPIDIVEVNKTFANLHAHEVEILGRINGIGLDSLVLVTNQAVKLPQLKIQHLDVDHLHTYTFFDYSFLHFLQNRMRKFSEVEQEVTGLISIGNLDILNDVVITSINGAFIDDVVFHRSDQMQEVVGHKKVMGNITFVGLSTVQNINRQYFTDFIKNSVLKGQNFSPKVMKFSSVILNDGLEAVQSINGYRIDELLSSDAHTPRLTDLVYLMNQVQAQIQELNGDKKLRSAKPKRILYIDHDPDVGISDKRDGSVQSRCAQNIVEPLQYNSVLVREKREKEMIVEVPSMSILVEPNFMCAENLITSNDLKIEWKFKNSLANETTFFRNFSYANSISDVKFIESPNKTVFMILTMQNFTSLTSEIVVSKLEKDENDWIEREKKYVDLNFITRSALVETSQHQFLVVSSFNEASPLDSGYVLILKLDPSTDEFLINQKKLPGGKFDIILGLFVSPKSMKMKPQTFLLLSKEGSKLLFIYRLKEIEGEEFVFQQKIPFESEIVEIVVLEIFGEAPYFIVSLKTGDFCVFEWRGIESWKVRQCGHFSNIRQIKSYEYFKRQHLFLVSALNGGSALTVYRQGENL